MSFLETPRFPQCPSFGFSVSPTYAVDIITRAGGYERRNRRWERPLHLYTCTVGPRVEEDIQELLEFWHAVGGMECGFRFKDDNDYKSCKTQFTPGPIDQPLVQITGATYQLTKVYTFGTRQQAREITKPVSGTILITDNGTLKTETTHYTIDYSTGIVTLLFTPTGTMTWGGEFDVPVRFDSELPVEIVSRSQFNGLLGSSSFMMRELRL